MTSGTGNVVCAFCRVVCAFCRFGVDTVVGDDNFLPSWATTCRSRPLR